ncbi:TPA: sensor histidine kinase [Escherichia coli]|uniref:sensor histidine kinase n=1 Tax=Enterobacter asburiae TaxID=61645 RepID=UPI002FD118DC
MPLIEELNSMVDNKDIAMKLISSETASERFLAAQFFIKSPSADVKYILISQRRVELVRHVKMALDKALHNIEKNSAQDLKDIDTQVDAKTEKARDNFLKAKAIDEFAGIILHELAPKIGMLKANAEQEIHNFRDSATKKNIDSLKRIFQAIESLRKSASSPESTEFDLAQVIKDVATEENKNNIHITFEGAQPCIIKSDKNILSLALANSIRNSLESLELVADLASRKDLTLCWGTNNEESWISIIDTGVGLIGTPSDAFKIGSTNKDNHTGFGLAIISQALETLGGQVTLANIETGGAKMDLRWGNF